MTPDRRQDDDDTESSGIRQLPGTDVSGPRVKDAAATNALRIAVRAALEMARRGETRVAVVLRGDPARPSSVRVIEGMVREITPGGDGRERVVINVSEDADQMLLVERITRVMPVD